MVKLRLKSLYLILVLCSISLLASSILPGSVYGTLSAPEAEAVYGGRINWIDAVEVSGTVSRVFISTESANSLFYADVNHGSGTPVFGAFQVVPGLDSNAGFGKSIMAFSVDSASQHIFFIQNGRLLHCAAAAGAAVEVVPNGVDAVTAYSGRLFYMAGSQLHFGTISASTGTFTEDAASPVSVDPSITPAQSIIVSPASGIVHVFRRGDPPVIFQSSHTYSTLNGSTTFSPVTVTTLGTGHEFRAFGIGPDGRIFAGTSDTGTNNKYIAYTDSSGDPWTAFDTGRGGATGPNIATSRTTSPYYIYFGAALSSNKGEPGSWSGMPSSGIDDSHANDGAVFVDPLSDAVVYLTTDAGIGASTDFGASIGDIVDGVKAVQINDFDMNSAKTIAWSASKSGVRRVTGYATASEAWSTFFPMDDGSPYYAIAMDKSDLTGNTAYAGNVRLYRTTDGGAVWTRPFALESYPGTFDWSSHLSAIAVSPSNPDVVFIGINSPSSGVRGAIFYTLNAWATTPTWTQLDTGVYNPEVKDLLYIDGGATNPSTIYAACLYVNDGTTSSYGVKTITYDPVAGTVTYDNDMMGSAGIVTNFGVYSLAINPAGDVYAAGASSGVEPRIYVKAAGAATWTMLTTAGLPPNGTATAITIGEDSGGNKVPFIAVMETIYYLDGSAWSSAYTYPTGMDINVLYWDDLLVGTGTGLYAQSLDTGGCSYTISPEERVFKAGIGSATISIIATGTGCEPPLVETGEAWITLSEPAALKKNRGSVRVSLEANGSSITRPGTVTIDNKTFAITQLGAACRLTSFTPSKSSPDNAAQTGQFTVATSPSDCAWTAAVEGSSNSWVTILTGGAGTGSDTVGYQVTENTDGRPRTGKIRVTLDQNEKKKVFTIKQRK